MRYPRQVLAEWFIRKITRPRREYRRFVFNDAERLKSRIRPGDVVLVDGDQRVAQVVKYLTMSSWSHSAIYIGSALLRDPATRDDVRRRYGSEARYLIVEALLDQGVVVSPLVKYIDFNMRVCRPVGLSKDQIAKVLLYVISHVGFTYDRRNILDLLRYLVPIHLVPLRLRKEVLQFGSGVATETICSSLLAEAFAKVDFPILPVHIRRHVALRGRIRRWMFGRPAATSGVGFLKGRHPTLCVPQDFDLSPYFDVIKFNARAPMGFPHARTD